MACVHAPYPTRCTVYCVCAKFVETLQVKTWSVNKNCKQIRNLYPFCGNEVHKVPRPCSLITPPHACSPMCDLFLSNGFDHIFSIKTCRYTCTCMHTQQVVMGSRPAAARVASANNARGKGQYRGICGCTHHIRDDARVLYFDDPLLGDVSAVTGGWSCVAGLRRLFCGGRGQAVRVQSRLCCGLCVRARGLVGLPCLPACCVCLCPSAALRYNMPAKVG